MPRSPSQGQYTVDLISLCKGGYWVKGTTGSFRHHLASKGWWLSGLRDSMPATSLCEVMLLLQNFTKLRLKLDGWTGGQGGGKREMGMEGR